MFYITKNAETLKDTQSFFIRFSVMVLCVTL